MIGVYFALSSLQRSVTLGADLGTELKTNVIPGSKSLFLPDVLAIARLRNYMFLRVKVQPSSKNQYIKQEDDRLIVYIKSLPVDGKANEELIKLLAKKFGVPQSKIRVKSGLSSRNKLIEILS